MTEAPEGSITWQLAELDRIGGLPVRVEGSPRIIESPFGRAVEFDGKADALFIDTHPLSGAAELTMEAYVRPDGGANEQRWVHLQADEPFHAPAAPGGPPIAQNARMLFELRVVGEEWFLHCFVHGPGYSRALAFPGKLHPVGRWHHVAQTFDGTMYRSYVNGVLEGEARDVPFTPQGPGKSSLGVRINGISHFRGAIARVRFTRRALPPNELWEAPR